MKTPEFSEFSYGHALVDSIMNGSLSISATAPIFPNLKKEGSVGGGYDVKIPTRPVPLFLQFKIPQIMYRDSINRPNNFVVPYYRMHLRTSPINQQNMLVSLAQQGHLVLYATPEFDSIAELDHYYCARSVAEHSAFFRPLDIGNQDESHHYVAYEANNDKAWVCSKPRLLDTSHRIDFIRNFLADICQKAETRTQEVFVANVLHVLIKTINQYRNRRIVSASEYCKEMRLSQRRDIDQSIGTHYLPVEEGESSLQRISYLSRQYLGCEFFVLGSSDSIKRSFL